ncbi:unknown protein [Waddlia chondrophila 2032/99]|uniref:Uncharacterized protein n=1 Tax=Waddlia chondrophila 2032/99 TaxID=765953 RepID=F8LAK0_9BACT|nr:hypothetical protein [Waddlia chondrophila]CCB90510.1 unknown protein [Waddlia chondrophila 2032/99]
MKCSDCINFFVMTEALAACGLKPRNSGFAFTNTNSFASVNGNVTATLTGNDTAIGSVMPVNVEGESTSSMNVPARESFNILSFPVTIGLQYLF